MDSRLLLLLLFFAHSPIEGHLDYFLVFAIMNKAAVNICVHIFM